MYTRGANTLVVHLVNPGDERMIASRQGWLEPADQRRLLTAVASEVTDTSYAPQPIILTSLTTAVTSAARWPRTSLTSRCSRTTISPPT